MAQLDLDTSDIGKLMPQGAQTEFFDSGFSGPGSFGVRVNAGGRRSFFVIYSIAGKRKRMPLGPYPAVPLSEARSRAFEIVRAVAGGKDPAAESRVYSAPTRFGELCQTFLSRHGEERLNNNTRKEYSRIIQKELLPAWKDMAISAISELEISLLLDSISHSRKSPVMALRTRALLSKIFQFAIQRHFVERNPVRTTSALPSPEPEARILSFEELRELFWVLDSVELRESSILKILLLTGQRLIDVMKLKWSDIELETWRVRDGHDIYLTPQVLQVLRTMQTRRHGHIPPNPTTPSRSDTYVFSTLSGGHPSNLRAEIAAICKKMGGTPWNARDIRRTFQYRIRELGVRPDVIERIQGRKTALPRTRAKFAGYDYTDDIRRALVLWAAKIIPPTPQKPQAKVIPLFKR